MSDEITLATIGTSTITTRLIDAVRSRDGIRLAATYSRDRTRAERFADAAGGVQAFWDLDQLLDSDVDAVYVGTPNSTHGELARRAIEAGKHVFLEKPAVPASAEFAQLLDAAGRAGVVVFEGTRNIYDPGMAALKRLLPEVGEPRAVSFALCQRSRRYDDLLAGRLVNIFDPALSGGALWDLGVYCLSAMVELFGEPDAIAATSVPVWTGVDGLGRALLSYPGFAGEVLYSKISASPRPSEIQGESGTILIDSITRPRLLTLATPGGPTRTEPVAGDENNLVYEIDRFVAVVRGDSPAADNARTLAVLRFIERVRAAAA